LRIMHYAFSRALRLLHPLMPFLTAELWHGMGYGGPEDSIMTAPWPAALDAAGMPSAWGIDRAVVRYVDAKRDLIRAIRTMRTDYQISPKQAVNVYMRAGSEENARRLRKDMAAICKAIRAETLVIEPAFEPERPMPCAVTRLGSAYMSIEGLVDIEAERRKLKGSLEKVEAGLAGIERKLENEQFLSKAPREVVEREETRRKHMIESRRKIKRMFETFDAFRD